MNKLSGMASVWNGGPSGCRVRVMATIFCFTGVLAAKQALAETETITYLHSDHLGSPVLARDASGTTVWQQSYSPWGEPLSGNDSIPLDLGYTGHYMESALGLSYMGARWYDPEVGRFLSPDAVGFKDGGMQHFVLYVYANSNPILYVDPDGNDSVVALNGPILSNPFGHTAQAFTGRGVYSVGTIDKDGGSFSDYVLRQAMTRDSTYYVFDTDQSQDQAMIDAYLEKKSEGAYDKLERNCASATAAVLKAASISDYSESRYVVPNTIAVDLHRNGKKWGAKEVFVPKGTKNVPDELRQFDPE